MIEVIYDKDKKDEADNDEKDNVNEKKNEFMMPKNIRQMGTPNPNKRIYIEDYVVTYLNYISRPGSTHARGAILLGNIQNTEKGTIIFISGAVDAQNIEFDLSEDTFTRENWNEIYKQIKENFEELSIVGWFLSRMGFTTSLNDKITKLHIDNFPGSDKVLYMYDSLDDDDAFYLFEKGELRKQKGYYIYYSKNDAMQAYIIKQKGDISDEKENAINKKDASLIKNFRQKNEKYSHEEHKSNGNLLYIASSFVVVALLAIGITVVNNYDKMKNMEVSLNRLELTSGDDNENSDDVAEVAAIDGETGTDIGTASVGEAVASTISDNGDENAESDTQSMTNQEQTNTTQEVTTEQTTTEKEISEENISTEQTLPAMNDENPLYYEVKVGDTLTSISNKIYNSNKYIEEIARANEIKVEDRIYVGQKLILPQVE